MAKIKSKVREAEPVGIVISSGTPAEVAPRLSMYIWGPAPDAEIPVEDMVAA